MTLNSIVWYDILYLWSTIELIPGGSSTVHIYSQTVHRTQWNRIRRKHKILGRVRAVPRLCELYPGICLKTEEKARKNLSQGSRRVLVYILPKRLRYKTHTYTPTHYKTHTYECKVRHTSIRDTPIMHSQRRLTECFRALHSQGHARLGSRVSQLYRYSTWIC